MFSLAIDTIRARRGGFVAAFVALFCGAVVITAGGVLLESGLRSGVPAERYAAADVVVGGKQVHTETAGPATPFAERVTLPAAVTGPDRAGARRPDGGARAQRRGHRGAGRGRYRCTRTAGHPRGWRRSR